MPTVQQWGRKESFIWPRRGYLYTLGALFLAFVATGLLPSEVSGLDDLRGFLKYGNHVARFSFPFIALEEQSPGFDERKMDDLIVPNTPVPAEPQEPNGNLFHQQTNQHSAHEME